MSIPWSVGARWPDAWRSVVALVLAFAVLAADLLTPLGATAGVAYVVSVLVGGWRSGPRRPLSWAALCTVLAAAGYILAPAGATAWLEPASRALALLAVWAAAAILARAEALEERRRQGEEKHRALMEALKASQERFKGAFDNAAVPMGLVDTEGRWISVNRAAADLLGYSPDELLKLDRLDITDPEDKEQSRELFAQMLAGETDGFRGERRYICKDGRKVWVDVSASIVRDDDGAPLYSIGHMQDITERRRAEEALRDSERRLRLVADNLPAVVSYIDATRRYRFVNKHHKEWFGADVEDAIGRSVKDVIGDGLYGRISPHVDEVLAGQEVTFEDSFEPTNGTVRQFQATYVPHIDTSGDVLGYFALAQDITERKRAEVELRFAKDRAEAANRAKTTFLSSMSHELRTPLNAILGFGQLMEASTTAPLSETQKEYVGYIMQGGTQLLNLIKEILELSDIESGALSVSIEDVALDGLFLECLKLTEPISKRFGVETFGRFEAQRLPRVRADEASLKQVLLNLLSNAVKYNRPGGTVRLECAEAEGGMVRLVVVDTGRGVPEHKQVDLFTPFARLGAEATDIEGTGVGLTLCKRLVALMGGRIGFESVEGTGSTFWVELPRAVEGQAGKATCPTPSDRKLRWGLDAGGYALLCIEDDPSNQRIMEEIVERLPDVGMVCADDAEVGLKLARKYQPDVIIMDINLPGMSGTQAVKRLKRSKKTSSIPVIALSANAKPRDVARGIEAGFDDYLTKPIDIVEVQEAIGKALAATGTAATAAKAS